MAGLFDLTAQQGAMGQSAADDAAEEQARIYERNEGIKAQNWGEAGKLVTDVAKGYARYRGAQQAKDVLKKQSTPPDLKQQLANEQAGRDPLDSGATPPSPSFTSMMGGAILNALSGASGSGGGGQ